MSPPRCLGILILLVLYRVAKFEVCDGDGLKGPVYSRSGISESLMKLQESTISSDSLDRICKSSDEAIGQLIKTIPVGYSV